MNIMHITRRPQTLLRINLLAILALVILLGQSQSAFAQWATNGNNINNTNTGNVGIGTTAPDLPLDIRRNAVVFNSDARALIGNYDQSAMAQGVGGGIQFGGKFDTAGTTAGFASISGIKENANNNDFSSALVFTTRSHPNEQFERMRITSTGNIGFGTNNPLAFASGNLGSGRFAHISSTGVTGVVLTGTFPELLLYDSDGTANNRIFQIMQDGGLAKIRVINDAVSGLTVDNVQVWNLSTGNVGIGTTGPTYKLSVSGNGGTVGESVLVTDSNTTTTAVDIANTSTGAKKWRLQSVGSGVSGRVGNFELVQIESDLKALVVQPGGKVGIGTTNPSKTLDVLGDINASGTITGGNIVAKYQDVAEWVPAAKALAPGTVVTLNPTQSNLVEASSKAYDTRVAGVISSQPGIALGESGANKVLVATTGRVRIKVDATNARIEIGDLLVTGEKEGVAMKSVPVNVGGVEIHRPGTIVGKALEPLAKGQGEILVLLSLQ